MANDDIRRKILARRTRFVVAALTSAGLSSGASGCCDPEEGMGQPCLSVAQPAPDASGVPPSICLSYVPEEGEDDEPQPCLAPPAPSSKPPTPG